MVGNRGGNLLDGSGGNDLINGKEGADILIGGRGADTLVGEAGADVCRYLSHLDSPAGASTRDFINGFEHGQDKIDLTALDGNLSTAAREGFRFISGQAFSGSAGEIRSFSWGGNNFNLVEIDLTGNAERQRLHEPASPGVKDLLDRVAHFDRQTTAPPTQSQRTALDTAEAAFGPLRTALTAAFEELAAVTHAIDDAGGTWTPR